jgi:hypothetical protein
MGLLTKNIGLLSFCWLGFSDFWAPEKVKETKLRARTAVLVLKLRRRILNRAWRSQQNNTVRTRGSPRGGVLVPGTGIIQLYGMVPACIRAYEHHTRVPDHQDNNNNNNNNNNKSRQCEQAMIG